MSRQVMETTHATKDRDYYYYKFYPEREVCAVCLKINAMEKAGKRDLEKGVCSVRRVRRVQRIERAL